MKNDPEQHFFLPALTPLSFPGVDHGFDRNKEFNGSVFDKIDVEVSKQSLHAAEMKHARIDSSLGGLVGPSLCPTREGLRSIIYLVQQA